MVGILLGRRCPTGGLIHRHVGILKTAAITLGICWFVSGFLPVSSILLGYGQLCCFCSGTACGISRNKAVLWSTVPIAIGFGSGFVAVAVLWAFN